MHFLSIIHIIGLLLTATGSSMLFPLLCALYYGESDVTAFLLAILINVGIGLSAWFFTKKHTELNIRDGIIIAVVGLDYRVFRIRPALHDPRLHPFLYRCFF